MLGTALALVELELAVLGRLFAIADGRLVAGCDSNRFTGRAALVEAAPAGVRFGLAFETELVCFETDEETDERPGLETDEELGVTGLNFNLRGSNGSSLVFLVI